MNGTLCSQKSNLNRCRDAPPNEEREMKKNDGYYSSEWQLYNMVLQELYMQDPVTSVIAAKANVSPTTIYNWRIGKTMTPRIDTLQKVGAALGLRVSITVRKTRG